MTSLENFKKEKRVLEEEIAHKLNVFTQKHAVSINDISMQLIHPCGSPSLIHELELDIRIR